MKEKAEKQARELERQITELRVAHATTTWNAQNEIDQVKAQRDDNYRRTQEHAEERVKAMCTMAREAQAEMYRNMETLGKERKRLTISRQSLSPPPAVPANRINFNDPTSGTGGAAGLLREASNGGSNVAFSRVSEEDIGELSVDDSASPDRD